MKSETFKILYINLGDNVPYTYDKILGRVLNWATLNHHIYLLVPELSKKNIKNEIHEKKEKNVRLLTLPFSKYATSAPWKIVFYYLIRVLFTPIIFLMKLPLFDVAISNSAFIVDVFPAILLKLFGKCNHWFLIMDSVVPVPKKIHGSGFINHLTYLESLFVGFLANAYADGIFTVNPELKDEMVRRGISPNKIFMTKNGLFLDDIGSVKAKGENYDGVYQGRVSAKKGVDDLVDVWEQVVKQKREAKLAILGTGLDEYKAKLLLKIKSKGLQSNIFYLGFTPKPKKYEIMKSAKVFLYLSKVNADESWGISLMESLACGLPAISYDLPIYGHIYKTESLIKEKNGDIKSVVRTTLSILKDNRLRLNLSKKALNFTRDFDWEVIAKEDLKIISDIINNEK